MPSHKSNHETRKNRNKSLWPLWVIGGGLVVVFVFLSVRHNYLDVTNQSSQKQSTFHESFPGLEGANDLDDEKRKWVVQMANAEPCICKCGHRLAHCLVADETCPVRKENRARVMTIINQARAANKGSAQS